MSYSASPAYGRPRQQTRRADAPQYDPLKERAKQLSDQLFTRAKNVANILAPDVPADQEQIDPRDQWLTLEGVAINLSPDAWAQPDAVRSLYELRKQFAPQLADPRLLDVAKYQEKVKRGLPDASVTPADPEFEAMKRRVLS